MKTLLSLILTAILACAGSTAYAQVTILQNADLSKYLARYQLVKELIKDMNDKDGKYVIVVMKNLDDDKAPRIAFVEQSPDATADRLKKAAWITVEAHPTERNKIVIDYFDVNGQKFFSSKLNPFK
ncbi:MAG: hypothetical protein WCG97_00620 [bacterium]